MWSWQWLVNGHVSIQRISNRIPGNQSVIYNEPLFSLDANRLQMIWIEFFARSEWHHWSRWDENFSEAASTRSDKNRCLNELPRSIVVKYLRWPKFVGGHHRFPFEPISFVFWWNEIYHYRNVWHQGVWHPRENLFWNSTAQWFLQYAFLSNSRRLFAQIPVQ